MMVLMLLTQGTAANSSFTLLLLLTKVTARQGVKPVVSLVLLLGESSMNVEFSSFPGQQFQRGDLKYKISNVRPCDFKLCDLPPDLNTPRMTQLWPLEMSDCQSLYEPAPNQVHFPGARLIPEVNAVCGSFALPFFSWWCSTWKISTSSQCSVKLYNRTTFSPQK